MEFDKDVEGVIEICEDTFNKGGMECGLDWIGGLERV